jgi:hypothetical protein
LKCLLITTELGFCNKWWKTVMVPKKPQHYKYKFPFFFSKKSMTFFSNVVYSNQKTERFPTNVVTSAENKQFTFSIGKFLWKT